MLTQQFFTRVQLAKILNFKSNNSIKDLEKKGFITPQIKPSKYTFNQVLFMMICKEIIDFTTFSWKFFIDEQFNILLQADLKDYKLFILSSIKGSDRIDIELKNDKVLTKDLNNYLDSNLLSSPKTKGSDHMPNFHFRETKGYIVLTFSIERIYHRLYKKCTELKIDLKEKDTHSNQSPTSSLTLTTNSLGS